MKGIQIFNLKSVSHELELKGVSTIYTRLVNASKGNVSGLTPDIVDAIIKTIKLNSEDLIKELEALKPSLSGDIKIYKPRKKLRKKAA